jgi:predicted dehydrogenase
MAIEFDRRNALKLGATVGAGLALGGVPASSAEEPQSSAAPQEKAAPIDPVRIGFVGIGGRGSSLVRLLLELEGVEIRAVCDLIEERVAKAQRWVQDAGQPKPSGYFPGETDFKQLCEREDLDLVVTATPWRWHVPVCVSAMKAGKHAATEVPAAVTVDECWQLVENSEKHNRHCVMLENCCYGRTEMMILNMVRKGLFGELIHGEAGYMHELREDRELIAPGPSTEWRLEHMRRRNGNLYPTHGLGPVAQCMNIDRGDRFDFLVSMSSKSRGLNLHYTKRFGADHPLAKREYALGDVNFSMIRTVNGCTIMVGHDTQLPRPYSRINTVQGTKGIFQGYPDRIHIETDGAGHDWESPEEYRAEYEHPLWKELLERAEGKGHGGMDYMELYRLIQALRTGTPPDMNVYDAASWSVVSGLSERSVANKSRPVEFPDFTRGKWKTNPPLGIIGA